MLVSIICAFHVRPPGTECTIAGMSTGIFNEQQRRLTDQLAEVAHTHPFAAERIERERVALGDRFDPREADWNVHHRPADDHPNVQHLLELAEEAANAARDRIEAGATPTDAELEPYEDLALFVVYHRWRSVMDELIRDAMAGRPHKGRIGDYERFEAELGGYLNAGGVERRTRAEMAHAFAIFFQIRRAFGNIYNFIIGSSRPTARLREAVWQSIFSHDLRRYRRVLFAGMGAYGSVTATQFTGFGALRTAVVASLSA